MVIGTVCIYNKYSVYEENKTEKQQIFTLVNVFPPFLIGVSLLCRSPDPLTCYPAAPHSQSAPLSLYREVSLQPRFSFLSSVLLWHLIHHLPIDNKKPNSLLTTSLLSLSLFGLNYPHMLPATVNCAT